MKFDNRASCQSMRILNSQPLVRQSVDQLRGSNVHPDETRMRQGNLKSFLEAREKGSTYSASVRRCRVLSGVAIYLV